MTTAKADQTTWKRLRYTIFRMANTRSSSSLLGKNTSTVAFFTLFDQSLQQSFWLKFYFYLFRLIAILFDRKLSLIVHGFCSGFSSLNLHKARYNVSYDTMEDRLVLLPLRLKSCSIDSILEVTLNKWNKAEKLFVFG